MRGRRFLFYLLLLILSAGPALAQSQPETTVISPVEKPPDTILFEDAKDKSKRWYLPRYRLATQAVSGAPQYRARFFRRGADLVLEVYLEKYAAPELGDVVRQATEMPHIVRLSLQSPRWIYGEYVTLATVADGIKATIIWQNQYGAAESVARQFVESGVQAELRIEREFKVLYDSLAAWYQRAIDDINSRYEVITKHQKMCEPILQWPNEKKKREQFAYSACLNFLNLPFMRNAIRERDQYLNTTTWRFDTNRHQQPPSQVRAVLQDRQSFFFDREIHPYVFAELVTDAAAKPKLTRYQFPWRGRFHSYFQTADRPDRWYYLPDRFELGMDGQSPKLSATFGGTAEAQTVEFGYEAAPWTDAARIAAAKAALQPAAGAAPVNLEALSFDDAGLFLSLPDATGSGPYRRREGVQVSSGAGVKDRLSMTLAEFQQLYAALFSDSSTIFSGAVRIDVAGAMHERIPFEVRVKGIAPELFWEVLMRRTAFNDYQKTIEVETSALVFNNEVKTLRVEFQEGTSVDLRADLLETRSVLRLSMRDFILNTDRSGEYHYRVITLRANNTAINTGAWKSATAAILYPEVP
jgi:hypothetical protein